jgi:hypothetical protein
MSIHEQDLHPAHFVQHFDDIRLNRFESVHHDVVQAGLLVDEDTNPVDGSNDVI